MSAFKIGGSPFRPVSGIASGKKAEKKAAADSTAVSKGGYDKAQICTNRLAVMPRMSTISGQNAQHLQGGTVESLLRDSAAELDDYFTDAYGFGKKPE